MESTVPRPTQTNSALPVEAVVKRPASSAIKSSWLIRTILPPAINIYRRFSSQRGRVVKLPCNTILKYGALVPLSEAHALQFVSRHTDIPVPRIITAFRTKRGMTFILMTRCQGSSLGTVFGSLDPQQQQHVYQQLRDLIQKLRRVPSPEGEKVGSTDYTQIVDQRICPTPCGPFENVAEFHRGITGGHHWKLPTGLADLDRVIKVHQNNTYRVVLTHGDLSFRNIIYDEGRITGIVDWETAGWFPEYWEYAQAKASFWDAPDDWRFDAFLDVFEEELEVEKLRKALFGIY